MSSVERGSNQKSPTFGLNLSAYDQIPKDLADGLFHKIGGMVKKSGYLNKQGGNWKNWKRRFFVLQGPFLIYYEDENSPTPNGIVFLEGCSLEICSSVKCGRDYCFEVIPEERKRTFILQGNSENHRDGWMMSLKQAIEWPTYIPELAKKYEEIERKFNKSKIELKKSLEQQDEVHRKMLEIQRNADDNSAIVSLHHLKMEEKEMIIKEQQNDIEALKKEVASLRIAVAGKQEETVISANSKSDNGRNSSNPTSSSLISELQGRLSLIEAEKETLVKTVRDLTEKYNKKRVERELLRKEVLRLNALISCTPGIKSESPKE